MRAAISFTHAANSLLLVGAAATTETDTAVTPPLSQGPVIINDEAAGKPIGIDLLARLSPQAGALTI
ncbi:hypothetical protein GCM10022224_043420 [Nonomuraea antimicrobica]|uniref:Uncharacterized protein n=1 Tax=Nonomuraea antimicrobica TaxID=561173 RepID=A0ABP7C1U3_9ACTN